MPLEPYQIISQYTLEPLLKSVVERIPNVDGEIRPRTESFAQDGGGVTARVAPANGETMTIRAEYMVGCDGGSSVVRKQLGFKMDGEPTFARDAPGDVSLPGALRQACARRAPATTIASTIIGR